MLKVAVNNCNKRTKGVTGMRSKYEIYSLKSKYYDLLLLFYIIYWKKTILQLNILHWIFY